MKVEEIKWELLSEKNLKLSSTKIVIVYIGGGYPYHVHRGLACHGMRERLADAKTLACELVAELLEMGMDP